MQPRGSSRLQPPPRRTNTPPGGRRPTTKERRTIYLDKLLTQLAYPLGSAWLAFLLAIVLLLVGRRHLALALLVLGAVWLYVWSLPVTANAIRSSLESAFPYTEVGALPQAQAAVILGGGVEPAHGAHPYPNLQSAADRVWHGARLLKAGKVDWLIVSGGDVWDPEGPPEARAMARFLTDLGVPRDRILTEGASRNTRENAVLTAELMAERGFERVLLVTSAQHMRRALATFRAVGVDAVPAPTDFEVRPGDERPLRWLPDAEALFESSQALKEYLGLWVYRLRGWA